MTESEAVALARKQLAPQGVLRVALNMSNFLLINSVDNQEQPDGVSPALARAIAAELKVPLQLIRYDGPGLIADAAGRNEWDIANIAAEPERAQVIHFTSAYCEIQASYLLPPDSPIKRIDDVDAPNVSIAVKERAAYDLWLTDNLQHATLHRADSHDTTFELFRQQKLDALAGLRPKLMEQQALLPGSTIFDTSFTAVRQCVGCNPGNAEGAVFLESFIAKAKTSGMIASLIKHYDVNGKLSVAS